MNHVDYEDLYISVENLNIYPLAGVPIDIEYSKSDLKNGNKIPTAMSVHDNELEEEQLVDYVHSLYIVLLDQNLKKYY